MKYNCTCKQSWIAGQGVSPTPLAPEQSSACLLKSFNYNEGVLSWWGTLLSWLKLATAEKQLQKATLATFRIQHWSMSSAMRLSWLPLQVFPMVAKVIQALATSTWEPIMLAFEEAAQHTKRQMFLIKMSVPASWELASPTQLRFMHNHDPYGWGAQRITS